MGPAFIIICQSEKKHPKIRTHLRITSACFVAGLSRVVLWFLISSFVLHLSLTRHQEALLLSQQSGTYFFHHAHARTHENKTHRCMQFSKRRKRRKVYWETHTTTTTTKKDSQPTPKRTSTNRSNNTVCRNQDHSNGGVSKNKAVCWHASVFLVRGGDTSNSLSSNATFITNTTTTDCTGRLLQQQQQQTTLSSGSLSLSLSLSVE